MCPNDIRRSLTNLSCNWCQRQLLLLKCILLILQLSKELEEIMQKQTAEPAKSCISNDGVSFLDQVVSPLYEIIAAVSGAAGWANVACYVWSYMVVWMVVLLQEAANNVNGRAPHSAWRNYDDFNEFFWYADQLSSWVSLICCYFHELLPVSFRSLKCFQLDWPWKLSNPFFLKPSRKEQVRLY